MVENRTNATMEKRGQPQPTAPETIDYGGFYTPLVDILETNEEFIIAADVPGVKPGDVDVTFENGVLSIRASVRDGKHDQQDLVLEEYGVGNYYRSFNIDMPINADRIKAELRQGELTVHLPKDEQVRTRRIEVKAA